MKVSLYKVVTLFQTVMKYSLLSIKSYGIHLRAVSQELLMNSILNMCFENTLLK